MAKTACLTLAGVLCCAMLTAPALADELTYVNGRFGTQFTLPAHMFDQIAPPPENGDGITFTGGDGALLSVFGSHNAFGETARQMRDRLERDRTASGDSVTYRASGQSWLVLSGYTDELIYYERHELAPQGTIHSVIILFPPEARPRYEPFIDEFAARLARR